jgi:phosphatidylserine/phosphatidylglycerophosphate/cardiolipin synthase-like enzyme
VKRKRWQGLLEKGCIGVLRLLGEVRVAKGGRKPIHLTETLQTASTRHVRLIVDRPVEHFLQRLFLRDADLRTLGIVSPFISSLEGCRFSLADLRRKVEQERICTYVMTREPKEEYQIKAMSVLLGCPWIEVRYNPFIHAKVYVAMARRESDSFGLFGSGNLTAASFQANIEVAMLLNGDGIGRTLLHELHYWSNAQLRTLRESTLVQRITAERH